MARKCRDDSAFVQFVADQLAELGGVRCRRMFGGYGLYCDAAFFGIVSQDRLYFKTGDETRREYEAAGMEPFRPTSKQTLKNYLEVPSDALENAPELVRLAEAAVKVSRQGKRA